MPSIGSAGRSTCTGCPISQAFLEASLLLPASVRADFNLPEWDYHGSGPLRGVVVACSSS
jgi:hypothetical protein